MRTVEAIIDEKGIIHLAEPIKVSAIRRALVTILDEEPVIHPNETALPSEEALAEDWSQSEEDAVWAHLQQEQ